MLEILLEKNVCFIEIQFYWRNLQLYCTTVALSIGPKHFFRNLCARIKILAAMKNLSNSVSASNQTQIKIKGIFFLKIRLMAMKNC